MSSDLPHADPRSRSRPSWDALYAIAEKQCGYFTTLAAASVGYSPQLLRKYVINGRVHRVRRGIYRLVHFPATEHEGLVVYWLWSGQMGVFSHESALVLHDLWDVLPSRVHMTVPASWQWRRLRIPEGLNLHYADIEDSDRDWMEAVPLTGPFRTLRDCIGADVSPDRIRPSIRRARQRGLISGSQAAALT